MGPIRMRSSRALSQVGGTVTIEGRPARDGTHYLRVRAVLDAAGKPIGAPLGETAGEQK